MNVRLATQVDYFGRAMSIFEKIAEARIDEAIAVGELTSPEGSFGPLDLESYFATPAEWRSAHAMLKSHGFAPPEVDAMKRVAQLEAKLAITDDAAQHARLSLEIQSCRTSFAMGMERMRQK